MSVIARRQPLWPFGMKQAPLLLVPTLVLIVLLWLPFGFHMGALIEDWGLLRIYSEVGPVFFSGATGELAQHQLRPLMTTLWAIAYSVDPDSWWFWHVELAISLLIKGASLSWIALYLTGSRRWAVVAGMLFVVWPADTLQMAFRALNIGFTAGLATLAAALFIAAYLSIRRSSQAVLALSGACCMVVGGWMYEIMLLMAPLPFLIMWAREGSVGTWTLVRRKWPVSLAWLGAMAVTCSYILYVMLTAKATYQQAVAGGGQQAIATLKTTAPMLFSRGMVRSLAGGWIDAARIVAEDFHWNGYLLVVALVMALMVFVSGRLSNVDSGQPSAVSLPKIALVGLFALLLGYAPFLVSAGHVAVTQRTFLFAASGSALVFVTFLVAVERVSRGAASGLAVLLLTLGVSQQLYQFREYTAIHERQRGVLRAIIEQAPAIPAGKTLVVLDESQRINHVWLLSSVLHSALAYLYNKSDQPVEVCLMPTSVWPRDTMGRQGSCTETVDAWIFKDAPPLPIQGPGVVSRDITIMKSNAIVVRINADGSPPSTPAVEENRRTLRAGGSVVSERYKHAIGANNWPQKLRFFAETGHKAAYRWDFGRRWNLDWPEAGAGWAEAEWLYSPFRQTSVVWMTQPRTSLVFPLEPSSDPYELRLHVSEPWADGRGEVSVSLNGTKVPAEWNSELDLAAHVPAGLLKSGMNTVEFEAPLSKNWGVSMHVDWIALAPTRH